MREIAKPVSRWLDAGEAVALATVIALEGSSLRPVGSHMAVSASGEMTGSVSGGCVEGAVFEAAQDVLAGGPPQRLRYGVVDEMGWQVGLACGGTVEIYLEPLTPVHAQLLVALAEDTSVALATDLERGDHLLVWADGRMIGAERLAPLLADVFPGPCAERRAAPQGEVFVQAFVPPPTLTIVGAVHIAQPLVRLAQVIGFRARVVDARRIFVSWERFPSADELAVAWPEEGLRPEHLRPQDAVVILTHDAKFDVPALEIALRSPVGYVGLLGSRTTQAKRRSALAERGVTEKEMDRIHGPVGLDLGGRRPEEIALAILAEVVKESVC
jgi:xanthine dehydrogenase accessory factor